MNNRDKFPIGARVRVIRQNPGPTPGIAFGKEGVVVGYKPLIMVDMDDKDIYGSEPAGWFPKNLELVHPADRLSKFKFNQNEFVRVKHRHKIYGNFTGKVTERFYDDPPSLQRKYTVEFQSPSLRRRVIFQFAEKDLSPAPKGHKRYFIPQVLQGEPVTTPLGNGIVTREAHHINEKYRIRMTDGSIRAEWGYSILPIYKEGSTVQYMNLWLNRWRDSEIIKIDRLKEGRRPFRCIRGGFYSTWLTPDQLRPPLDKYVRICKVNAGAGEVIPVSLRKNHMCNDNPDPGYQIGDTIEYRYLNGGGGDPSHDDPGDWYVGTITYVYLNHVDIQVRDTYPGYMPDSWSGKIQRSFKEIRHIEPHSLVKDNVEETNNTAEPEFKKGDRVKAIRWVDRHIGKMVWHKGVIIDSDCTSDLPYTIRFDNPSDMDTLITDWAAEAKYVLPIDAQIPEGHYEMTPDPILPAKPVQKFEPGQHVRITIDDPLGAGMKTGDTGVIQKLQPETVAINYGTNERVYKVKNDDKEYYFREWDIPSRQWN